LEVLLQSDCILGALAGLAAVLSTLLYDLNDKPLIQAALFVALQDLCAVMRIPAIVAALQAAKPLNERYIPE
jgi:hypothetical protein